MKKLKNVILILLVAVVLVGFYWHFSQKSSVPNEIETEVTELDKVLAADVTKADTPRAVVKLYSRITKCFYDYELSDEELDKLTDMSLALFDAELLEANPKAEYIANLSKVIDEYNAADRVITDYTIQDTELIEKYYVDGVEYAKVNAIYNIKDVKETDNDDKDMFLSGCGSRSDKTYQYYNTYEEFLLRRDSEGNWKILVWRLPDLSELEED